MITNSGGGPAFGMQLPVQAQSGLMAQPWESAAGPAELAAVAELRERLAAAGRAGEPFAIHGGMGLHVGAPGSQVPPQTVAGEPERVAGQVRELAALGVTHVQVRFPAGGHEELIDQIAAFAGEVMPLVRDAGKG